MGLHTTDVVVLRRYAYRETSVIVNCLTERYGKLKGLVKGLRAQPSRYRSAMEPLTINRIVFYDTRTSQLHLISQCDLLLPLLELQRDVETMRMAARCADLVDAVVPLEEPQPLVYYLLKDTLERLALGGGQVAGLHIHFISRLLRLAGFRPRLDECAACNAAVQKTGYWSVQQGGLLCPNCLHEDPKAEHASAEMLAALAALSGQDHPPALEEPVIGHVRRWLDEFLRWRLERPLRTLV